MKKEQPYDLEERILDYSAGIIRLTESLPNTRAGNHVAGQMPRSGTSPLANDGEAEAAESTADFIPKLRICLKELLETNRWIKLARRVPMVEANRTDALLKETDELIRIFVASIRTPEKRRF